MILNTVNLFINSALIKCIKIFLVHNKHQIKCSKTIIHPNQVHKAKNYLLLPN